MRELCEFRRPSYSGRFTECTKKHIFCTPMRILGCDYARPRIVCGVLAVVAMVGTIACLIRGCS